MTFKFFINGREVFNILEFVLEKKTNCSSILRIILLEKVHYSLGDKILFQKGEKILFRGYLNTIVFDGRNTKITFNWSEKIVNKELERLYNENKKNFKNKFTSVLYNSPNKKDNFINFFQTNKQRIFFEDSTNKIFLEETKKEDNNSVSLQDKDLYSYRTLKNKSIKNIKFIIEAEWKQKYFAFSSQKKGFETLTPRNITEKWPQKDTLIKNKYFVIESQCEVTTNPNGMKIYHPSKNLYLTEKQLFLSLGLIYENHFIRREKIEISNEHEIENGLTKLMKFKVKDIKMGFQEWQSKYLYNVGKKIIYQGQLFECLKDHLSNSSFELSYWSNLTWKAKKTYLEEEIVLYEDKYFICNRESKDDEFNYENWKVFDIDKIIQSNINSFFKTQKGQELVDHAIDYADSLMQNNFPSLVLRVRLDAYVTTKVGKISVCELSTKHCIYLSQIEDFKNQIAQVQRIDIFCNLNESYVEIYLAFHQRRKILQKDIDANILETSLETNYKIFQQEPETPVDNISINISKTLQDQKKAMNITNNEISSMQVKQLERNVTQFKIQIQPQRKFLENLIKIRI